MNYAKDWIISFKCKTEYHRCLTDTIAMSFVRKHSHAVFSNEGLYDWNIKMKHRTWTTGMHYTFSKYNVNIRLKKEKKKLIKITQTSKKKESQFNVEKRCTHKVRSKEEITTTKLWRLINQLS